MLQCIIDVTLKLIKPQLKELSSKKSRIKCQKDTYYQRRVAIDKSAVEKGRKVPEYAYRRKQGVG